MKIIYINGSAFGSTSDGMIDLGSISFSNMGISCPARLKVSVGERSEYKPLGASSIYMGEEDDEEEGEAPPTNTATTAPEKKEDDKYKATMTTMNS